MTDADWWDAVRQQREAGKPRELCLWRLVKNGHVAEARVRAVPGRGVELRFAWDGDLRQSQIYDDHATLASAADQKRQQLLAAGWIEQAMPVGGI